MLRVVSMWELKQNGISVKVSEQKVASIVIFQKENELSKIHPRNWSKSKYQPYTSFRNTSRYLASDSCSLSNPCYVKFQLTDQNKRKVLGCEKIKRRLQGRINAFHQKLMRLTIQIYKQTWFNRSFYVNCRSSTGPFEHVVKI